MEMRVNKEWLQWWPLILLLCTVRLPAQDALRKRILLPATQISANDLRKEISRQTGLQFSFGSNTFRPGRQIRLQKKDWSAKELLDMLKAQLQTDYKVYKDHVIFTASRKKPTVADVINPSEKSSRESIAGRQPPNALQHNPTNTKNSATPQILKASPPAQTDTSKTTAPSSTSAHQQPVAGEVRPTGKSSVPGNLYTIADPAQPVSSQTSGAPPNNLPAATRPLQTIVQDEHLRQKAYHNRIATVSNGRLASTPSHNSPQQRGFTGSRGIFTRYTTMGVEVNETFPGNFLFKGGIPLLHGIVSFSATSGYSSWRYGAGTRWSFNDLWHAQANFTTGKVKDALTADSLGSISKTIDITETLHRIGLQAERSIGKRWAVAAGLSWNMLNRINTADGNRLAPGGRVFNDPIPESGHRALKPLYTISSSFHDGSKTWKDRWIGAQVGVYFRF